VPPRILYTAPAAVVDCHGDARLRRSFIALFVLRMAVGALEAPAYPINSRVVTTWFPSASAPRRSVSTPPGSLSAWRS
jgi:ACS family D-galactonate transporter-like MFS transporter